MLHSYIFRSEAIMVCAERFFGGGLFADREEIYPSLGWLDVNAEGRVRMVAMKKLVGG